VRAAAALLLLAGAPAAAAQAPDPHAAQPERPTVATHAWTVAPGWAEVEAGAELDRYRAGPGGGALPVVLKLGLAPRLQLEFQGAATAPPGQGAAIGDLALALKWRLADDVPLLGAVAIQPSLKLPTATTTAAGTGTTDAGLLLIVSHRLGAVEIDANAGYVRRSGDGSRAPRDATVWTVSAGGPIAGNVGWVGECFGYPATSGPAGAPSSAALLGGPTVQLRPWLVVDAGVIAPLAGEQPTALYAGVVYNLGRVWRAGR
jgi:hypothetical protein